MSGFTGTMRLVRLALRRDRITCRMDPRHGRLPGCHDCHVRGPLRDASRLLLPDTQVVIENPGMRVLGLVTGPTVGGYTLHRDALTLAGVLRILEHGLHALGVGDLCTARGSPCRTASPR